MTTKRKVLKTLLEKVDVNIDVNIRMRHAAPSAIKRANHDGKLVAYSRVANWLALEIARLDLEEFDKENK